MTGVRTFERPLVRLSAGLLALAACGPSSPRAGADDPLAATMLPAADLVIGADYDAPPEYQFQEVRDLLPLEDGSLWLLDGTVEHASIRRYDAEGTFLSYVSSFGEGPGEFQDPRALAQLQDGRVLVTDYRVPQRLTIFAQGGVLDEEVRAPDAYPTVGAGSTFVDEEGFIWRMSSVGARPTRDRPPPFWALMRVDGTVVDTVHIPALPVLDPERSLPWVRPDGTSPVTFTLPYRPQAYRALSRSGRFLLAPRDAYQVYWVNPAATGSDTLELFISRDVPKVEVSAAERAARREETYASIEAYAASRDTRPDINLEVPEVPAVKPYLRGLIPMHDGGVMVMVSVPSVEGPDGWVEPDVRDIFDREGRFVGRLEIPEGHWLFAERDGVVWTVYTYEMGVQSVHRHALPVWR